MKSFKLLVVHDNFLKEIFSLPELADEFSFQFTSIENFDYFRPQLKSEFDLIIFSTSLIESEKLSLLENIEIPSVAIFKELSEDLQIELLDAPYHIDGLYEYKSSKLLVSLLNRILVTHEKEKDQFEKMLTLQLSETNQSCSSDIDPVTGLDNLQAFTKKAREILKKNPDKEHYILRFDFDDFKLFNENYGYEEGDKLLRAVGDKLRNMNSALSSVYCHLHSDHFAVLLEVTAPFKPDERYEDMQNYLTWKFPQYTLKTKLGIYKIQSPDESITQALSRALMAIYSIKNSFEQHSAYYTEELKASYVEEQILAAEMVTALEEEQFAVFLQPQYDYTTESLNGAEALVRWIHPEKGLIPPVKFIPLFEKNGFITRLDIYMWDHVCRLIRKWKDQHLNPVPVSVNISRRDIYDQDLVEIFSGLLKKYRIEPKDLHLEITESAYMDNPEQLISVVEKLQGLGFQIEMDDFGSGYSSLNTLKDVPVNVLKLDMKFIDSSTGNDKERNSRGGSILSSVVRMANWLKLPVIAEGIESKAQADYLKSIGCFHMQGYYFGKPMPVDQFEDLMMELPPSENIEEETENDVTNALDFLDASNQNALLFNSFVGGAAIIEWTGASVEIIRANEQFCKELSANQEQVSGISKNILPRIKECCQNGFLSSLVDSKHTGKEAFCEIQFKSFYDDSNYFWLRTRCRHIGKTVTSDIFYFAIDNIDFKMQLLDMNTTLTEQLSAIMEYVPSGIICSRFTQGKLSVDYINAAFARMFKSDVYTVLKLLTEKTSDYIPVEMLAQIKHAGATLPVSQHQVISKIIQMNRADKSTLTADITIQMMRKSDDCLTVNCVVQEITQQDITSF